MHANKPLHLAFLSTTVLAIVLLSGCTTPVATTGNGVSISSFSSDLSPVYSGETVNFRLLVKNLGTVDAKNAHAELLGLDEDWCKGTNCDRAGSSLEKLPNEEECKYTGSGFNLFGRDAQMGIVGGEQACSWTYVAPSYKFSVTYQATARVFYSYKSAVSKQITFGSTNEIRRIQDSGGKLAAETTAATESPIQLSIETTGPIRFWDGGVTFPLEITIKNIGGGTACSNGGTSQDGMKDSCNAVKNQEPKNKITLKIALADGMTLPGPCSGFSSGQVVSLYNGQSNTIRCDVQATGLPSSGTVQKGLQAEAYYEYYIDGLSPITVMPRGLSNSVS